MLGPLLVALAIWFLMKPSKNDPRFPGRKRRDWWVIGGLFLGGIAAHHVTMFIITHIPQLRLVTMFINFELPRGVRRTMRPARSAVSSWLWRACCCGRRRRRPCCARSANAPD